MIFFFAVGGGGGVGGGRGGGTCFINSITCSYHNVMVQFWFLRW